MNLENDGNFSIPKIPTKANLHEVMQHNLLEVIENQKHQVQNTSEIGQVDKSGVLTEPDLKKNLSEKTLYDKPYVIRR